MKVRIAVKDPGKAWEVREVEDDLEVYQEIVEGYIECAFTTSGGIHVFCNEFGKINGMKRNVIVSDDYIFGPIFAVRSGEEGEFVSLTDDDLLLLGIMNVRKK